jgi:hypothetical protein
MNITLEVSINHWKELLPYRKVVSREKFIAYIHTFEQEQKNGTNLPELCTDEELFSNPLLWRKLKRVLEEKRNEIELRAKHSFNETDTKNINFDQPHKVFCFLKNILQREFEKQDLKTLIETL